MQPQTQRILAIASPDSDNLPLARWQPPTSTPRRGTLLFLYGGSTEQNFSLKTASLSKQLATRLGFDVLVFDYRGNANGNRFHDFGMHDRIEDAKRMIEYTRELAEPPFTLLGMSMGGHIAVRAAAETDPTFFANVILIAPAAYSRHATKPGVLFGAGEGRFKEIITRPGSWLDTDAFKSAEAINARWLLIRFDHDTTVVRKITDAYYASLGRDHCRNGQWYKKLAEIPGEHQSLGDPRRIGRLIEYIDLFTALPVATAEK